MRRINADVGTYLAGADAGAAEADVLMSTGARRQKHLFRRPRHCRCGSLPAEHTNDADVVFAEPEPADSDADSGGRSDPVMWMWKALRTRTSQ